jgi:hypothetical protein
MTVQRIFSGLFKPRTGGATRELHMTTRPGTKVADVFGHHRGTCSTTQRTCQKQNERQHTQSKVKRNAERSSVGDTMLSHSNWEKRVQLECHAHSIPRNYKRGQQVQKDVLKSWCRIIQGNALEMCKMCWRECRPGSVAASPVAILVRLMTNKKQIGDDATLQ